MALRDPLDGKLAADTLWNFGALGLMAASGAAINFFLAGQRGAETLGVFNQVYALYAILALLAAMGIHDSAQRHAAELAGDPTELAGLTRGALVATLVVAAPVAALVAALAGWIGEVTASVAVGRGMLVVAPGVLLFAMNKTLLGVLNGLRRMRTFAIAQSVRVVIILAVVIGAGLSALPHWAIPAAFTAAELALFPLLLVVARPLWSTTSPAPGWLRRHLFFGGRALPNSLLAESFVRIDVIMLGLFVSDPEVGVYSFAAFFVEGIYQVAVVVRTVSNPILVRLLQADRRQISRFCKRVGGMSMAAVLLLSLGVLLCFPLLARWLDAALVAQARALLWVLLPGLWVYSAFIPSDQILLQAGRPTQQSLLMTINVAINAALNVVLIRRLGLRGAALATALAYVSSAVTLSVAAWRTLGPRAPRR